MSRKEYNKIYQGHKFLKNFKNKIKKFLTNNQVCYTLETNQLNKILF